MRTQDHEGIIGRDHSVGLLRAEIGRVADSHGGLVLVTGEAGIGKTTLVTVAAEEARRRGALVLSGSCWDSESAPGYWPWVQVVRGLRRGATPEESAAAESAAGAGLAVLLGEPPGTAHGGEGMAQGGTAQGGEGTAPADAFHLYDAVTTALVCLAQRRPVVVVLDDLHWADTASLRLLEFAAQHTWFEPLLLIGTYRDVEVESAEHDLQSLMLSLVSKATTVTLTGLAREEVGELMARTAGREPDPALVAEVHRRTGGNPFFVEQTARLWRAGGSATAIAPGVRDAVRRRVSLLPEPVVELLTSAAVLGQEFQRQVLAACAGAPAAQVDQLLDRALATRLVVSRGAGRFAFTHDLVRETLYDALADPERRRRHAAVVRTVDAAPALAGRLLPADLARHAHLAGGELEPGRAADHLVAAARDAGIRLAFEEAVGHLRRALDVADEPPRRARISLELGKQLHRVGDTALAWRSFDEAAALARQLDDAELLARVALTGYWHAPPGDGGSRATDLLREARRRLVGETDVEVSADRLVPDLIAGTEALARRGHDDEALTFSLRARHDTIWGLGTAREREALTIEMDAVARRSADHETRLYAASLRWVALLEQGDPRYFEQLQTFVAMSKRLDAPRSRLASAIDCAVVAAFRGEFDQAEEWLAVTYPPGDHGHGEYAAMGHHLRWALWLLRGRFDEIDDYLRALDERDHRHVGLLRAVTAVERGDVEPARRLLAGIDATGTAYPRFMGPLLLRLRAQAAAAAREPGLCEQARRALAPHRDEWAVSLYGCDISGPVHLWIAVIDASMRRWDDAVAGFTAARDAADRLGARPWSITARAGLADALAGRGAGGDADAAEALRAELELEAVTLGMPHILERVRGSGAHAAVPATTGGPSTGAEPAAAGIVGQPAAAYEFRRDGAVWRLGYGDRVVHLPDAKGLRDLHQLLSQPGTEVAAVELLDPAAGAELVAARRMGGDPMLDDEAKARYKRRLEQLDEAIDRAARRGDEHRAAPLDDERKALVAQLRAAAGLAGRGRRLGDEAERARKTVTARIRDTLRRLDEGHPELAAHLRDTVSTGAMCRYGPADTIRWRL